jgi:acetyl-CoA acetyltransferase|tara:strand:- start:1970 stop:3139 length:1170 start_codon:yes stop_codon:yes gene_type:complete
VAKKDIAIVGYAETKIDVNTRRSPFDFAGEVLDGLLAQTGLEKDAIDGFAVCSAMSAMSTPFWSIVVSDYLGMELDWCQQVDIGGSSPLGAVARAASAIRDGQCEIVFVLGADSQSTQNLSNPRGWQPEFQNPVGLMGPPGAFGFITNRYDGVYGLDYRALAKIAVTQREHAVMNDNAYEKFRKPITEQDYLDSRMISDPIRLLDCVMPCDGGNGVIVMSTERAKSLGMAKMVHPIGFGERDNHGVNDPDTDILETGHCAAGPKALTQAGMTVNDVHMFQPYDDFIIAVMLQMENIGFCKRGEGCAYVMDTDFSHTGDLPLNTSGGQISAGQAGLAGGGTNLVEAVRQLMGDGGARQVKDASNAMVTGIGAIPYLRNWSASTVMILEAG